MQEYLPNFLKAEAEARESTIDHEAYIRHKRSMAMRWFKYYHKCNDEKKKMKLIDQYNFLARERSR